MKNLTSYISITVAMIIWSSSFVLTQIGLESFQPVTLVTIRMVVASLLLFLVGVGLNSLSKIASKRDFLLFFVAGFVQPFAYFVCEAYGLTMVSATVASVVLSTIPIFTPLFALLIIKERVTVFNVLGLLVSLTGVVMILLNKDDELRVSTLGIILLFAAVISAILYTVILRKVPSRYSNVSIVFYIHTFSLVFFVPTFFMVDVFSVFGGEGVAALPFQMKSLVAVLLLAVFASVLSYVLFCKVLRVIGATKANAFCNIMPASTALIMWIAFGEQLSLMKWVGIFVVVLGLFVSQVKRRNQL